MGQLWNGGRSLLRVEHAFPCEERAPRATVGLDEEDAVESSRVSTGVRWHLQGWQEGCGARLQPPRNAVGCRARRPRPPLGLPGSAAGAGAGAGAGAEAHARTRPPHSLRAASRPANARLGQARNRTKPVDWVQLEPPARAPSRGRAAGLEGKKKKNFAASWTSGSAGFPGLFSQALATSKRQEAAGLLGGLPARLKARLLHPLGGAPTRPANIARLDGPRSPGIPVRLPKTRESLMAAMAVPSGHLRRRDPRCTWASGSGEGKDGGRRGASLRGKTRV